MAKRRKRNMEGVDSARRQAVDSAGGRFGKIAAIAAASHAKTAAASSFELTVPLGPVALVLPDPSLPQLILAVGILFIAALAWSAIRCCLHRLGRLLVIYMADALGGVAIFEDVRELFVDRDIGFTPEAGFAQPELVPEPEIFDGVMKISKGTQSQVTYSALRGATTPRFQPLADCAHGAWDALGFRLFTSTGHALNSA